MVNVLVLEDNVQMQQRLVRILRSWEETSELEAVTTNHDCAEMLKKTTFDVLLVDLDLPDGSGHESIRLYSELNPIGLSIVISALSDGQSIIKALKLGAIGYLHKDDSSLQIIESIKLAISGQSPVSPSIAHVIISKIRSSSEGKAGNQVDKKKKRILTEREIEVLSLIAKGLSYGETATVLGMSKNTLPVHIRNIYRKLHAANRSEAVYEARSIGIEI
jgi:DNA-binding NarL/FixJ family response regulator